jgi:hypothetical protein
MIGDWQLEQGALRCSQNLCARRSRTKVQLFIVRRGATIDFFRDKDLRAGFNRAMKELSHATEGLACQFTTKSLTVHDERVDNSRHLA